MNSKPAVSVDVQFACDDPGVPHEDEIRRWVQCTVMVARASAHRPVEVAVRVVEEEEIRTLNNLYRQQDENTNVLSFPAGEFDGLPEQERQMLGDIVICASVVNAEAALQEKSLADHWGHMLVHGTLHLLGHDHQTAVEATQMEALEVRILAEHDVRNPYAAL